MKVFVDSIGAGLRAERHVSIERDRKAVFAFLADDLRNSSSDYRITKSEGDCELRFEVLAGKLRPRGIFRLVPDGVNRTLVSFALELEPRGWLRLRLGHIRRALTEQLARLDALKSALEAGPGQPRMA